MEPFSTSRNLNYYLVLLRHWIWLFALTSFVSAAVAYFFTARKAPVYEASTTLLISEVTAGSADDYSTLRANERLALTYAELMTKDPVIQGVIERLALDRSAENVVNSIKVRPVPETQLILAKVQDTNPERAALIANTLAAVFVEQNQASQISRYAQIKANLEAELAEVDSQIKDTADALDQLPDAPANKLERDRLQTFLAQYRQTYASLLLKYEEARMAEAQSTPNVQVVQAAKAPSWPVSPNVPMSTVVGGLFGLVFGVLLVLIFEVLDDSLRNPEEILKYLGLPVLGLIVSHAVEDQGPISASEPRSPVAEAFRSLRTSLQFTGRNGSIRSILLTSPSPGEGKSLVAANLAVVLAQSHNQVILVDADLRRPTIHGIFALHNRRGVSNLFYQLGERRDGKAGLASSLQNTAVPGLKVLTSGRLPPNPAELLASEAMGELLDLVRQNADYLVIDSPPLLAVTDAAVLAPRVDGVLLVIKPGATKLAAAKDAADQLRQVCANLLGVVLNDIDLSRSSYYYHKYRSYYYDRDGQNVESPAPGKKAQPHLKARSKS
jgi:capsular exopolysaccharide synthesis family protein